ncbi:MAG: hypothetical protein V2J24_00050 [Pseudomonadales bacterium]|jgi:hypothetical protein|nr:hypothetical protein [Pseudomonadales bacterium]
MRVVLRAELDQLSQQLSRLEAALEHAGDEPMGEKRARARASLLAILDRLA